MTAFRVARLKCDLCRRTLPGYGADTAEIRKQAKKAEWRTARLPNASVVDVCDSCAREPQVLYFIHRPGRIVEREGYPPYRSGAFWSRGFWSLESAKESPQFDDHAVLVRADIRINPNSKRLMKVEATTLLTKAEYEMLDATRGEQ